MKSAAGARGVRSRLTIAPVSALLWETSFPADPKRELSLESIYLGAAYWEAQETSQLVLAAPHGGWTLTLAIADETGDIHLDDLETPYLYSKRKA